MDTWHFGGERCTTTQNRPPRSCCRRLQTRPRPACVWAGGGCGLGVARVIGTSSQGSRLLRALIAAPRLSQPGSGRPYPHLRHLCHRAGRHGDRLRWTWPWAPSNSSLSRLPSNSACANRETGFSVHTHTPMSHKTTPQDQIRNTHHVTHTHPCRTKRHPRNTHHVVHTRVLPPSAINCKGRGAVLVQGGHLFLILAFQIRSDQV